VADWPVPQDTGGFGQTGRGSLPARRPRPAGRIGLLRMEEDRGVKRGRARDEDGAPIAHTTPCLSALGRQTSAF